ncbi:MAG: hypothetical protein C0396_02735 [Anaerolinea sp.]|nr:hypothetical protein [Anaerolinea sp.]
MPILDDRFKLRGIIKAYVLHAAGVGESQVDEWIGELETSANPTVGLLAHPGQIDIRVTAKASSELEADAMIQEMVSQVHQRVGEAIFGSNQETLEQVVLTRLSLQGWKLSLVECGFGGAIFERLAKAGFSTGQSLNLAGSCQPGDLQQETLSFHRQQATDVTLGAGFYPGPIMQTLYLYLIMPNSTVEQHRSYGGPPQLGPAWAVQTALDFIRRNIS